MSQAAAISVRAPIDAQPLFDDVLISELADLNAAFLHLLLDLDHVAPPEATHILEMRRENLAAIASLTTTQFKNMCRCSYALFDLHLAHKRDWDYIAQGILPLPFQQVPQWAMGNKDYVEKVSSFSLGALHYTRHLVLSGMFSAQLALGIGEGNSTNLARIPVSRLQQVANQSPSLLTTRFSANEFYWKNLIRSANQADAKRLQVAQVSGLHLIAGRAAYVA